jgi:hypothetical protein
MQTSPHFRESQSTTSHPNGTGQQHNQRRTQSTFSQTYPQQHHTSAHITSKLLNEKPTRMARGQHSQGSSTKDQESKSSALGNDSVIRISLSEAHKQVHTKKSKFHRVIIDGTGTATTHIKHGIKHNFIITCKT